MFAKILIWEALEKRLVWITAFFCLRVLYKNWFTNSAAKVSGGVSKAAGASADHRYFVIRLASG
jgi:hypothetical protein